MKLLSIMLITITILVISFILKILSNKQESFTEQLIQVDFIYADWCGHCTNFKPEWKKFEQSCKGKNITTSALNVDDETNKAYISKNQVSSFPTIIIFKGSDKTEYKGERTSDELMKFVESY
jgi:thiol-disulfide isomerase/thioredoxin